MRPEYLTPKLTDAHRLEIRRLRGDDPKSWTLRVLAQKFGVNRSTVSRVMGKPLLVHFKQIHESAMAAAEGLGQISTRELLQVKHQEWSRQLLIERDLSRQQQLVNLIKSVAPMLESGEALTGGGSQSYRSRAEMRHADHLRLESAFLVAKSDEDRALDALRGYEA